MSIAGIILGILAIITAWMPLTGSIVAIPLAAVGLPFSLVAFRSARRNNDEASAERAIAGITLNLFAAAYIGFAVGWLLTGAGWF